MMIYRAKEIVEHPQYIFDSFWNTSEILVVSVVDTELGKHRSKIYPRLFTTFSGKSFR